MLLFTLLYRKHLRRYVDCILSYALYKINLGIKKRYWQDFFERFYERYDQYIHDNHGHTLYTRPRLGCIDADRAFDDMVQNMSKRQRYMRVGYNTKKKPARTQNEMIMEFNDDRPPSHPDTARFLLHQS